MSSERWAVRLTEGRCKSRPKESGFCEHADGSRIEFIDIVSAAANIQEWRRVNSDDSYKLVKLTRKPRRSVEERIAERIVEAVQAARNEWAESFKMQENLRSHVFTERDAALAEVERLKGELEKYTEAVDGRFCIEKCVQGKWELWCVQCGRDSGYHAEKCPKTLWPKMREEIEARCEKKLVKARQEARREAFAEALEDVHSRYEPRTPHRHGTISMDHRDWLAKRAEATDPKPAAQYRTCLACNVPGCAGCRP